ncbi:unnamed protein product [Phytophthora lilii]|uniref:Unnamed protein product n=1 Tax=Phytophthora lilii TaxID=2077276 RepID=A0A9W6TYH0_9STRA|nr:unnamed protein product [Phytophthora lilii]
MVDVLYIPGLDRRLLSVGKLAERGMNVEFQRSSSVIWGKTSATQRATKGMPSVNRGIRTLCGGCMKGKQTVEPFPSRFHVIDEDNPCDGLVHTDVMGPMKKVSKGGARYVLTFVDDYSRYVVAYFLRSKSEVAAKLDPFKALYENQWGQRLKCLRSDNGTEFVNKKVAELCSKNGIMHQRTVPYSPQQNGVAERMNRTIMEKARSMLYYKGVSTEWWAEAVSTAIYLINRSTNTANPKVTPYELSFKEKPRMEPLRVFGSQGTRMLMMQEGLSSRPRALGVCLDMQRTSNGTAPVVDEPMDDVEEPVTDVEMDEAAPEQEPSVPLLPPSQKPSTGLELTPYRPTPEAFSDDRIVFHPEPERLRRSQEPIYLLEDDLDIDEEQKSEDSYGPSSPKRPRVDEDGLLAEAVVAYASSMVEATDPPSTYAQAMGSADAAEWREAINTE